MKIFYPFSPSFAKQERHSTRFSLFWERECQKKIVNYPLEQVIPSLFFISSLDRALNENGDKYIALFETFSTASGCTRAFWTLNISEPSSAKHQSAVWPCWFFFLFFLFWSRKWKTIDIKLLNMQQQVCLLKFIWGKLPAHSKTLVQVKAYFIFAKVF